MSNAFSIKSAILAALVSICTLSAAHAADDRFCRDYARAAVNQFSDAARHNRCDVERRDGGRWNPDWRAHYDWCRGVSREAAWDERNARKHTLDHCARRW